MFDYSITKIKHLFDDLKCRFKYNRKVGKNRILVVQVEGLGNAILTTPLINAIKELSPDYQIDVLIDKKRGTFIVFQRWDLIDHILSLDDYSVKCHHYDVVFECHPRKKLQNNIVYKKRYQIPVKPKPYLEYHWWFEKHESKYLLDMIRPLGFKGGVPHVRELKGEFPNDFKVHPNTVAIGIGYYKGIRADEKNWSDRHWGNENFIILCNKLNDMGYHPVLVGDQKDYDSDGYFLEKHGIYSICGKIQLNQLVGYLSQCFAFIGNDTGLMHIAASLDLITIGIFVHTNSIKSRPLGKHAIALGGDRGEKYYKIDPGTVIDNFYRMVKKYDSL